MRANRSRSLGQILPCPDISIYETPAAPWMLSVSTSAKNLLPIRCISDGKDHIEVITAHQLFSALTPCLKWWRGVVK
jgi:hypothetical protein